MPHGDELENSTQVFIIHPDNHMVRRYLSNLLNDNNNLLYSRFSGMNLDFVSAGNVVFDQFAYIGDKHIFPDVYVLDEVDRLSTEAFNGLLPYLIQCYPISIILFSRTVPPVLFQDEQLSQHIQIVSDTDIMHSINSHSARLEVSGFGIGRVRFNGLDIELTPGELVHELFFFLLEHDTLSREHLISVFWSHLDRDAAIDSFHMTLKRLNNLLGIRILQLTGGHYRLNPDILIQYDVQTFRETLQDILLGSTQSDREAYENAYRLHHHDFLQGINTDWISEKRQELRELQSDVCVNYANILNDPEKILGLYLRAFRYNPYREDIPHAIMSIYLNKGLPCDALKIYKTYSDNLLRLYAIQPGKALRNLMQEAKANCTP